MRRRAADGGGWPQVGASPSLAQRGADGWDSEGFPGGQRVRELRGGQGVPQASSPGLDGRGVAYLGSGSPDSSPQRLLANPGRWSQSQTSPLSAGARRIREEADAWWGGAETTPARRVATAGEERRDGGSGSMYRTQSGAAGWATGSRSGAFGAEWGDMETREEEVRARREPLTIPAAGVLFDPSFHVGRTRNMNWRGVRPISGLRRSSAWSLTAKNARA